MLFSWVALCFVPFYRMLWSLKSIFQKIKDDATTWNTTTLYLKSKLRHLLHHANCHFAKCPYDECRYAVCGGAIILVIDFCRKLAAQACIKFL
jgi:hypothetical protein